MHNLIQPRYSLWIPKNQGAQVRPPQLPALRENLCSKLTHQLGQARCARLHHLPRYLICIDDGETVFAPNPRDRALPTTDTSCQSKNMRLHSAVFS